MFRAQRNVSVFNSVLKRQIHENAKLLENITHVQNRNPRNLELLRIARKPAGYWLDKRNREYWHKLEVVRNKMFVNADIIHFENGKVVSASSNEWSIKKHLYKTSDISAYINIGRILGQRCLESGIYCFSCFLEPVKGGKLEALIEELIKCGLTLEEPPRYFHPNPWDSERPEKPWEVNES
ncbi:large ribosomal subunit protein uL18m [Prorops nasuta]|uniref:large ribosomal subunit protein uL18m n=1 Tax=Prorops nasuta TaxID=863751 RepID=UPI0034CE6CEA